MYSHDLFNVGKFKAVARFKVVGKFKADAKFRAVGNIKAVDKFRVVGNIKAVGKSRLVGKFSVQILFKVKLLYPLCCWTPLASLPAS